METPIDKERLAHIKGVIEQAKQASGSSMEIPKIEERERLIVANRKLLKELSLIKTCKD